MISDRLSVKTLCLACMLTFGLLCPPAESASDIVVKDGDTIRTDRYRYSEYRRQRGMGSLAGRMLYDHRSDPGENVNVVAQPANESTVKKLSDTLNQTKAKVSP